MANKNLYDLNLNIAMDIAELTKNSAIAGNKIDGLDKKFSGTLASIKTSWLAAAAIIAGGLKAITDQMKSTEGGADKLEKITGTLEGGMIGLNATIASGDWGNLIRNITLSAAAMRNLKVAQDQLDDITASNALKMSILNESVANLRLQIAGTTDPTQKAELIRQAIETQKEITLIEKEQQQQRIENQYDYYQTIGDMGPKFAEAFKREVPKIAANWQLFGDESYQALLRTEQSTLQYKDSLGILTQAEKDHLNQLNLTLNVLDTMINLRDNFSKPGEWNNFILELAKLNDITAKGDENLLRFEKTLTSVENKLGDIGSRKPLDAESLWRSLVNPTAEPALPVESNTTTGNGVTSTIFADPKALAETVEAATIIETTWVDSMESIGGAISSVSNSFASLGDAISRAMEDGKVDFVEGMNIIM